MNEYTPEVNLVEKRKRLPRVFLTENDQGEKKYRTEEGSDGYQIIYTSQRFDSQFKKEAWVQLVIATSNATIIHVATETDAVGIIESVTPLAPADDGSPRCELKIKVLGD